MTDKDTIQSAYEEALKNLFKVLHSAYTTAETANEKKLAEKRFTAGVSLAQTVRDRAIASLP